MCAGGVVGGWVGVSGSGAGSAWTLLCALADLGTRWVGCAVWLVRGGVAWRAGGANPIGKSGAAAALTIMLSFFAWKCGPGDWRFWTRSIEPPAASVKAPPLPQSRRCTDPLSACFWGL